jgi:hypothetical protein
MQAHTPSTQGVRWPKRCFHGNAPLTKALAADARMGLHIQELADGQNDLLRLLRQLTCGRQNENLNPAMASRWGEAGREGVCRRVKRGSAPPRATKSRRLCTLTLW